MRIYRRSATCNNVLVFVVGSIPYWHILQSIENGQTALDYKKLLQLAQDNIYLVSLMAVTAISILKIKKWSLFPFVIFTGWISFNCLSVFFGGLDKLILILGFVYILCSFYFYLFLKMELQEVIYCPGYSLNNIGKKAEHDFNALLELKGGDKINGYLSNWGQNGCFVVLQRKFVAKKRSVTLSVNFEGQKFEQKGEIVTSYGTGVGVKFIEKMDVLKKYGQNWQDFYTIIKDRGYLPQDIRRT